MYALLRGEKAVKESMYVLDPWGIPDPERMEVNQKPFYWVYWILDQALCT